jgi:hypothetical protein
VAGKEERWERSLAHCSMLICSVHKHSINNAERAAGRKSKSGFFVDESEYSCEVHTSDSKRETGPQLPSPH